MADNVTSKTPKTGETSKIVNTVTVGGNDTMRLGESERIANHPTCLNANTATNQRKKAPSFQITSVSVGSNSRTSNDGGDDSADDLDESHTDDFSIDNSRITDIENETPSFSEDTFSKDEQHFNPSIVSVPVIPTSSQYGLAIVGTESETCVSNPNLINTAVACANSISTGDASVSVTDSGSVINLITNSKSDIEMRDLPPQHPNRNERFKVVKIESTEPFKRGRWMCMDYLDHTILQQQQSQLAAINAVKQIDADSTVGPGHFIGPDTIAAITSDNLPLRTLDEHADTSYKKSGACTQDNHPGNQQNLGNLTARQALPGFPIISPGQSLHLVQDSQQMPVISNTQKSINPQPQLNPQTQQVNSQQQQMSSQSQQLGSQPHPMSSQVQSQAHHLNPQSQQIGLQTQQINPQSQLNSLTQQVNPQLQHQFTSQQIGPQSHQFNTQPQQVNQSQQMAQQSSQFNSQNQQMNTQPQQFTSQPQQFNHPSQQMQSQMQQNLQGQNFQSGGTQQVSQAQSMTQVPIQCAPSMTSAQALQHQSLPPQQLQQVLNAVNMQQMNVQQGLVQQQHLMQQVTHQGMNQFQQQPQYYGQGGIQMLPSQGGMTSVAMSVANPIASVSLQHPQPGQVSASPMTMQSSGAITSQSITMNQRQQQIGVQNQQQQQMQQQLVNQQTMQQMASRQPQNLQSIPLQQQQQQQQVPIQPQYSVQQQFPLHQQTFPIQQFPVQQQSPIVQLFQQQQVPMQSQVPVQQHQQQLIQQNYQPLSNIQQPGQQIMARNITLGDTQMQASHLPPVVPQQNYIHQVPTSSQNEAFFNTANARTDKPIAGTRMVSVPHTTTDTTQTSPIVTVICQPQSTSIGTSTMRLETNDNTSADQSTQVETHVDMASTGTATGEEQPQVEDPESASGTSAVAIDNKIEQAMDLVKSHLMFAVREEVEVLKEKIAELMERISQLEVENNLLRAHAPPEVVAQLPQQAGAPPTQQSQYPPNGSVS